MATIQHIRHAFNELVDRTKLLTDLECSEPVRLRDLHRDIDSFTSRVQPVCSHPYLRCQKHFIISQLQHLDEFDNEERLELCSSLRKMLKDVEDSFEDSQALNRTGVPHPVTIVPQGQGKPGAPFKVIDPTWLAWAATRRNTSDIARFLDVSRDLVQRTLYDYGMRELGEDPFIRTYDVHNPDVIHHHQVYSISGAVSSWTDAELDAAVTHLRIVFPRAGVFMLKGAFQSLGHNVPRERIRHSLLRLDPENRLFERPFIERREYWVPGPGYLWHHDGQHGLWILSVCLR